MKKPPYEITNKSLNALLEIAKILGHLEGIQSKTPQPELRKQNRVKTIQGSLAIEGNTLSTSQITALLDNKKVIGPKKDILEVTNAIDTYSSIQEFRPNNPRSMLKAHGLLLKGLLEDAGQYRSGNVGIFKGKHVAHVAPKSSRVPPLMKDLFEFLKKEKDTHPIIKSCVFHYELMFIHPFSDGNGRIGRLWQTVILMNYHPIFEFVPIESLIKEKQIKYYKALEESDSRGDSTVFIEFIVDIILTALSDLKSEVVVTSQSPDDRLNNAREHFLNTIFSRKDYITFHKTVSSATASRDLKLGLSNGILNKVGSHAQTRYQYI